MTEIYGIDLGTTNSCIATLDLDSQQPIVIKNSSEMQTTPSVVFYDEYDQPIVGDDAKRSMASDPRRTVAFIKREMSNPDYYREIGDTAISPVKISALILKKLVDDANMARQYEGKTQIMQAVITVPAYFGNEERMLTRQAGELAGLEVLDLLNEPTAAALSYGKNTLSEGKTIMVYDLGGGTFDVSIMQMTGGQLNTIATDGDHHLGGVDWDAALVDYALITKGYDETYDDLADTREGGQLILAAEQCKKMLSQNEKAPLKFRYKGKMEVAEVHRSTFEELTQEKMDMTMACVHNALRLAGDEVKIDEIILVGGSSRMPMVRRRLEKEFPNIHIRLDQFEPDLAVAKGAAIHAQNLATPETTRQSGRIEIGIDKGSRSYGVAAVDLNDNVKKIFNLIFRTDSMECTRTDSGFSTLTDGQQALNVEIYENASPQKCVSLNKGRLLKRGEVRWGYPVKAGTPITYKVHRGKDGIIHFSGICEGQEYATTIEPKQMLSDDQMMQIIDEFEDISL